METLYRGIKITTNKIGTKVGKGTEFASNASGFSTIYAFGKDLSIRMMKTAIDKADKDVMAGKYTMRGFPLNA